MLDPLLALHTARLVLESDDHWGGAGTHPNYKNTQQYVSGLVAIVESHTGISAVSQLRGIAAAARPDSSSSSSSTPVCMASKQTLIETLQVPHELATNVVGLWGGKHMGDAVCMLQLLSLCGHACWHDPGSSSPNGSAALQILRLSMAKQVTQSGLMQLLPGMLHGAETRLQAASSSHAAAANDGGIPSSSSSSSHNHSGNATLAPPAAAAAAAEAEVAAGDAHAALLIECRSLLDLIGVLLLIWPGNAWASAALMAAVDPACRLAVAIMRQSRGSSTPLAGQQYHQQQQGQQQQQSAASSTVVAAGELWRQVAVDAMSFCLDWSTATRLEQQLQTPLVAPLQQLIASHRLMQVVLLLLAAYGHALDDVLSTAGQCSSSGGTFNDSRNSNSNATSSQVLSPCLVQQLQLLWGITPQCVTSTSQLLSWCCHQDQRFAFRPRAAYLIASRLYDVQHDVSRTMMQTMTQEQLSQGAASHMLVMLLAQNCMAATAALHLHPSLSSGCGCGGRSSAASGGASSSSGDGASGSNAAATAGAISSASSSVAVTPAGINSMDGSSDAATNGGRTSCALDLAESQVLWLLFDKSFRLWSDLAVRSQGGGQGQQPGGTSGAQLPQGQQQGQQGQQQQQQGQQQQQQELAPLVAIAGGGANIPPHHCSAPLAMEQLDLLLQAAKWHLTEVLLQLRLLPDAASSRRVDACLALLQAVKRACNTLVFCNSICSSPGRDQNYRAAAAGCWWYHTDELAGLLQAVARQLLVLTVALEAEATAAAAQAGGLTPLGLCCELVSGSVVHLYMVMFREQPRNSSTWPQLLPRALDHSALAGILINVTASAGATIGTADHATPPAAPTDAFAPAIMWEQFGLLISLSKVVNSSSQTSGSSSGAGGHQPLPPASRDTGGRLGQAHCIARIAGRIVTQYVAMCAYADSAARAHSNGLAGPAPPPTTAAAQVAAAATAAQANVSHVAAMGEQLVPWMVLFGRCLVQYAGGLREWLVMSPTTPYSLQDAYVCYVSILLGDIITPPGALFGTCTAGGQQQQQQSRQQRRQRQRQAHRQQAAAAAAAAGAGAPGVSADNPLGALRNKQGAAGQLLVCHLRSMGLDAHVLTLQQAVDRLHAAADAATPCMDLFNTVLATGGCSTVALLPAADKVFRDIGINSDVRQRVLAAARAAADAGLPFTWKRMLVCVWQACPEVASLADALHVLGVALTSLPISQACNNPRCTNLAGLSEQVLVGGGSCVCGGCRVARYCGRACQFAHWQQHKPVCRALAAAAAVQSSEL